MDSNNNYKYIAIENENSSSKFETSNSLIKSILKKSKIVVLINFIIFIVLLIGYLVFEIYNAKKNL